MGVYATTLRGASERAPANAPSAPQIGPNAVLQTLAALVDLEGPDCAAQVRARAQIPDTWAEGLIPEAWFVATTQATRDALPPKRAEAVLREAGARTADYVAAHRIPGPVRGLLRVLPPRLAVPLLLKAFARHAWTFAGRGRFTVEGAYPGTIRLEDCPTCREPTHEARGGAYYEAAFTGLLRLAAPDVSVVEADCHRRGAPACRYPIHLSAEAPAPGESSCASS